MLNVLYHIDSVSGISSIKESLLSIRKESLRARIFAMIVHVAENNGKSSSVITKNIRGYHFSEIRLKSSRDLYRVLFFVWKGDAIVLLHLFIKKEGESTSERELKNAEEKYQDFINNQHIYE